MTNPILKSAFLTLALLALGGLAVSVPLGAQPNESQSDGSEAEEPAEDGEPETFSNTIRWSTASEVENFGFDVYRGTSADGPFERLNPDAILGAGTVDTPQKYAYEDDTIDACTEYFYYVESIALTGDRERFTPVGKASAKLEADDPRCSERPEA